MHPISRKNSKVDPYGRRRAAWVFDSISHFTIRSHIMDFKQFYKQRKKLSHVFRIKCLRFVRVCRRVLIFHFFGVCVFVCVSKKYFSVSVFVSMCVFVSLSTVYLLWQVGRTSVVNFVWFRASSGFMSVTHCLYGERDGAD